MSLSEFDLINRFFSALTPSRADVVLGIGDDCALIQTTPGCLLAVSTDTMLEGRHFFAGTDPENLGHKILAVNLSDMAAMGAEPRWVNLALTLPEINMDWLSAFACGFARLAECYDIQLIGGDTTRGPLSLTVTIQGEIEPDRVLRRSGANEGDLICITGQPGQAALALEMLKQASIPPETLRTSLERPWPRVEAGRLLAGHATAAVDISDGLLADLQHICEASGVGARIDLGKLPLVSQVEKLVREKQRWDLPLSGGDDYELCFTLPASQRNWLSELSRQVDCDITVIGEICQDHSIQCFLPDGQILESGNSGFDHFG